MTRITITDPSEGNPGCTGYYSMDIERNGKLDASVEVSPQYLAELLPDVDSPEDVAQFFDEAAEGARAMADAVEELE